MQYRPGAFCVLVAVSLLESMQASAAVIPLPAKDSGFVTSAGGSAKGDGPVAKFNYSVGYELHYSMGAPSPLMPMIRKNYFVFDFGGISEPIISAKLKLYTGVLETVPGDPFETYVLKETPDQPGALGDALTLASTPHPGGFDSPGDFAIAVAASLFMKIGAGSETLASIDITSADDGKIIPISFTADGVDHLNLLRLAGGPHLLGGLVTTVDPSAGSPQQPFGFTGPDIPGGGPLVPVLELTTVPEPMSLSMFVVAIGFLRLRRSSRLF